MIAVEVTETLRLRWGEESGNRGYFARTLRSICARSRRMRSQPVRATARPETIDNDVCRYERQQRHQCEEEIAARSRLRGSAAAPVLRHLYAYRTRKERMFRRLLVQ